VSILKSSDLKNARIDAKTLVIWDESHYAQGKKNLPNGLLERSGLKVTGTPSSDDLWAAKQSYFLSVSATPFAQFSDVNNMEYANTCVSVQHIPGASYIGVEQYFQADRIHPSFSIKNSTEEFTALLATYVSQKKYALVRSRNLDKVKECCRRIGAEYKEYTSVTKGVDNLDALKTAPTGLTVIGLKGMCRMGKVVPKQHVAFVFEDSKASKTDCVLQSLLGRMCGYGPYDLPDVYVSPVFLMTDPKTGLSELDRYRGYTANGKVMPAKAAYLAKGPTVSGKFLLPYPVKLVLADEDEEDYGAAEMFREAGRDGKAAMVAERMMAYYHRYPLPDVVQYDELMLALAEPSAHEMIGIHDLTSETYGNIRANLLKAESSKNRYDDPSWDDRLFKAYYDVTGSDAVIYFTGYTVNASHETQLACKAPYTATTGGEVWNHRRDDEPVECDPEIVNDADEIDTIRQTPGLHTVWIKKSLLSQPKVADVLATRIKGKGGKYCPKQWRNKQANYERIRFIVNVSVAVAVSVSVTV
jgi:hypothetical protein